MKKILNQIIIDLPLYIFSISGTCLLINAKITSLNIDLWVICMVCFIWYGYNKSMKN